MQGISLHRDSITNKDNKEVTCFTLLDLSPAFDAVNHKLLLNRLKYRFGIDVTILQWIESCLTNCTQRVKVDNLESDQVTLTFGVSQGLGTWANPLHNVHLPTG